MDSSEDEGTMGSSGLHHPCTVKKEMKCSGDSEILPEKVRDTSQIRSRFSDFHEVSRTISCSISESKLHSISFLIV